MLPPPSRRPATDRPIPPGIRWAWAITYARRLRGAAFKVLSIIAYRAMHGTCYPSHTSLGEDAGLSYGGVRKAVAELEQAGAISVSGSGGRRADGGGLSCTYRLNLPPEEQDNVPRNGGEPAPEVASTCPKTGVNLSPAGRQKISKKSINIIQKDDAPDGAGSLNPSEEASDRQVELIARLAVRRHGSLHWVPRSIIADTIRRYAPEVCEAGWADCDRYSLEGTEAAAAYRFRFEGRRGQGGWDHYRPQPKRTEPLTTAEASAWIQALQP